MFRIASNSIAGIFKFRIDLKQFQTFESHDLVFIEALASVIAPPGRGNGFVQVRAILPGV